MSQLRRGFVKEAQSIASEEREELHLRLFDPLDPWTLAENHGVPVLDMRTLTDGSTAAEAVRAFSNERQEVFSAALLPLGNGYMVIENGCHARTRRVANVTHEMSHVLLEHGFHPSLASGDCRGTASLREKEADRLVMELLIPRDAALVCARRGHDDQTVAAMFGVSEAMAKQCMNRSGARQQARREQQRLYRA